MQRRQKKMPVLLPLLLVVCAVGRVCPAAAERACTAADWVAQYTECRVSSNTRDLLYYKDPATGACAGGVPCPAHVFGLRCDIACGAGHYLPPGTTACVACPAGAYALGGGARAADFSRFPHAGAGDVYAFTTHAVSATGARIDTAGLWHVADAGLALRSGRVNNSQSSYLTLPLHVCKPLPLPLSQLPLSQLNTADFAVARFLTFSLHLPFPAPRTPPPLPCSW